LSHTEGAEGEEILFLDMMNRMDMMTMAHRDDHTDF